MAKVENQNLLTVEDCKMDLSLIANMIQGEVVFFISSGAVNAESSIPFSTFAIL
jgi:hypothetical protein